VTFSLFGTDGIRGQTSLEHLNDEESIERLIDDRTLTPAFMRLLGESLAYAMSRLPGSGEVVVIGWDDRPHNTELVASLTLGLRLNGCYVVHLGLCATPALHAAVLEHKARMGCMITASHNPVSDSGIKVFDGFGYKSTPMFEQDLSQVVRDLSQEEREVNEDEQARLKVPDLALDLSVGVTFHRTWLARRWTLFDELFGGCSNALNSGRLANPLLLDCAGGSGASWLAEFLTQRGAPAEEVSHSASALNKNCGAGDFSPTQTWTHSEASSSPHALLSALQPAPAGQLVAAALDGDGDRCLFIESTEDGYKIVDGDGMAAMMLEASSTGPWRFAASIESDVALTSFVEGLHPGNQCMESAVGDRWLSEALRTNTVGMFQSETMPLCLGVEDSGHVVLPAPHEQHPNSWALVGDGAATLCAFILSQDRATAESFQRGWKRRRSIAPSERSVWAVGKPAFNELRSQAITSFEQRGMTCSVRALAGEADLLLLHGTSPSGSLSLGIRNSGTQAKTNVSLRLSPGLDPEQFKPVLGELVTALTVWVQ